MTSISAVTSASGSSASSGTSNEQQIARLNQQIKTLTQQAKSLASSLEKASADEEKASIQEQQQLVQAQIQALQAQIARLQNESSESKQQQAASTSTAQEEGVNKPTEENKINIYVWLLERRHQPLQPCNLDGQRQLHQVAQSPCGKRILAGKPQQILLRQIDQYSKATLF